MADLDTLRPEVRRADSLLDWMACTADEGAAVKTIRAELLRLAKENRILEVKNAGTLANNLCPDHRDKQVGRPCLACLIEKAESELAALKARIAEAPVVACPKTLVHAGNTMQTEFLEYTHERMPGGCNSWAGKRVRLVVDEPAERGEG